MCFFNQMESSMCQFDAEFRTLRHQKLRLDCQLKLADLRQLTLYQELLILKEFERKEDSLQEKLNSCIKEENSITVRDLWTTASRGSSLHSFGTCVFIFV